MDLEVHWSTNYITYNSNTFPLNLLNLLMSIKFVDVLPNSQSISVNFALNPPKRTL